MNEFIKVMKALSDANRVKLLKMFQRRMGWILIIRLDLKLNTSTGYNIFVRQCSSVTSLP